MFLVINYEKQNKQSFEHQSALSIISHSIYTMYIRIRNIQINSPIPNCDSSRSAASGFVFQFYFMWIVELLLLVLWLLCKFWKNTKTINQ